MRLYELLNETISDDRMISKVASALYNYLSKYYPDYEFEEGEKELNCGTIGSILELPESNLLSGISIILMPARELFKSLHGNDAVYSDTDMNSTTYGVWDPVSKFGKAVELNAEFIQSNQLKTTIAHELRHGLDNIKSSGESDKSVRYITPRKKEHRREDPHHISTKYLAQPAEINARTMEVEHDLARIIPMVYKKIEPEKIKARILKAVRELLAEHRIAELFPEKSASPQYKQIIKRILAFIQDEMKEQEELTGKSAQGSW